MKKQMMKVVLMLTVTTMLLAGCGEQGDAADTSTETSAVENEISTQEDNVRQEETETIQNEEDSEMIDIEEEGTESEAQGQEESETEEIQEPEQPQKPEEPQEPEQPQEPEEPQEPTHKHKYTGVVTKEPGCYYAQKPGEMTYTCSCGDSYVEALEFLPCSDLSDGIRVTVREPDCQHEGRTCEHCKYCGQELYPGTLPMTEHVPSEWLEIPRQGKKFKVCINCGITLEKELLEQTTTFLKIILAK